MTRGELDWNASSSSGLGHIEGLDGLLLPINKRRFRDIWLTTPFVMDSFCIPEEA